MSAEDKARVHLQSAIKYLGFGMDPETEERRVAESKAKKKAEHERQKNAEHEAYQHNKQKSKCRLEAIYGHGGAPTVAGILHFAEIRKLSGLGPNKIYCIGEIHGNQKSNVDYITEYKRLLTANDQSENPDNIDFFIEDVNVPYLIMPHLSKSSINQQYWIEQLRNHLQGCYANPEDIEYITGIAADSTEFSDKLSKCPYKHTRVHWSDPGCFDRLWSESDKKFIYGMSYQENPEWLVEAQKVKHDYKPGSCLETFKKTFPHVASHIKGENNLYNIVEANPYIQDQLRRSIYCSSLFQNWFDNDIAKDKQMHINKGLVKENDYWWRMGIFTARRRAVDMYTFLRMTRRSMSAKGRFRNVIVHAGLSHTRAIVSLFRFVESDHARYSIIERDEQIQSYRLTDRLHNLLKRGTEAMQIDLCKAINFDMGGVVRKKAVRPALPSLPSA